MARRLPVREPFSDNDQWQVNELDWYEGSAAGSRGVGVVGRIPGAMIRAPWRTTPASRRPGGVPPERCPGARTTVAAGAVAR